MLKTISEVSLAKDLVKCQSVTPKDDGAINVVAKNLKKLGFKCQIMEFQEKGTAKIKNLYAKIGNSSPNFMLVTLEHAGSLLKMHIFSRTGWRLHLRFSNIREHSRVSSLTPTQTNFWYQMRALNMQRIYTAIYLGTLAAIRFGRINPKTFLRVAAQ